jgi:hypothetical protein
MALQHCSRRTISPSASTTCRFYLPLPSTEINLNRIVLDSL